MSKNNDEPKSNGLQEAINSINKAYGAGSIMRLGSDQTANNIKAISTGSISLDCALGIGGVPRGRIIEIYGPESSGKTTLMLHIIANVQKAGGTAAFIDAEHALDAQYAKKLGVNLDNLLVSQPSSGEEALTICETLVRSNALDLVIVDSVAALVPQSELDGDMGMATMGMQARLMSQALRKLTAILHKADCICAFTNQLREKVGVMFGSPETTSGGKALKFYASVRLDIRRKETIKDANGAAIGNHVKVKVVKNKVAPPFCEAEFDIMFGKGINKESDLIETALTDNLMEKKGAWIQWNGELIGQGKEAACQALRDNPQLAETIAQAIRSKHKITAAATPPALPQEADEVFDENEIDEIPTQAITPTTTEQIVVAAPEPAATPVDPALLALIEKGIDLGIIKKKGAWLDYNGTSVGHGKNDAAKQLPLKPELLAALTNEITTGNNKTSIPSSTEEPPAPVALEIPLIVEQKTEEPSLVVTDQLVAG